MRSTAAARSASRSMVRGPLGHDLLHPQRIDPLMAVDRPAEVAVGQDAARGVPPRSTTVVMPELLLHHLHDRIAQGGVFAHARDSSAPTCMASSTRSVTFWPISPPGMQPGQIRLR